MKKLNVLFLLLTVFAFSALAQNGLDEKGVDNSDYFVNAKADVITVVLDASSPVYARRFNAGYSSSCDHLSYAHMHLVTLVCIIKRFLFIPPLMKL